MYLLALVLSLVYFDLVSIMVLFSSELTETAMAVGGALLFSLFIIFDTQVSLKFLRSYSYCGPFQMIMTRLSAEEYIVATIQLYLDIINLFIEILKILEKVNRK